MLIVLLRVVRLWCSVGALFLRFQPVRPQHVVCFIQNRRRSLRVIRIHGLKTIRNREQQSAIAYCNPESNRNVNEGYIRKLRNLISSAICKPGKLHDVSSRNVFIPFSVKMVIPEPASETELEPAISTQNVCV